MLHRALCLTSLALTLCFACTQSEDGACGDDTVYEDGYCRPAPTGGSGGSGATGATDSGGTDSSEGGAGGAGEVTIDPNYGKICTAHEDCEGVTDYCADSPVMQPAYCTSKDCDPDDPSACPPEWNCTDVGKFIPGEPFVCTHP